MKEIIKTDSDMLVDCTISELDGYGFRDIVADFVKDGWTYTGGFMDGTPPTTAGLGSFAAVIRLRFKR